jgi:hypothetical protein
MSADLPRPPMLVACAANLVCFNRVARNFEAKKSAVTRSAGLSGTTETD